MATLLIDSKEDRARAERLQAAVDDGFPIVTKITKRPSDYICWVGGIYYGGEYYPPSDPRGAELEKLRYLLPAPKARSLEEWRAATDGYDETCGMQPLDEWRRDFLHIMYEQMAVWFRENTPHDGIRDGFRWAAEAYLLSAKAEQPKPTSIAPQELQSNEEVLEQIAMSRAHVSREKVDELLEAIQVAIKEWDTNANARILPDGYYLYGKPDHMLVDHMLVPIYIYLKHPSHPSCVVAGELSITSDKDTRSELKFVSSRDKIWAYMLKVKAGMKPSTNPKLPGIMMQAPISEPIMTPQIQTLKNHTEGWEAFMAVLNDGSAD